jgi:hypothetical protein
MKGAPSDFRFAIFVPYTPPFNNHLENIKSMRRVVSFCLYCACLEERAFRI